MFIVLAILITAAALLAVAYPILSKGSATKPATTAQESLDELLGERDAAMQALPRVELRPPHGQDQR